MLRDIRHSFRMFLRAPLPTLIALLSIAISVGATAVVFTAVRSVLLKPLPYLRAGELVQIGIEMPKVPESSHSDWVFWDDMQEVVRSTRTLASVGMWGNAMFTLAGDAHSLPEALYGARMSASLFPTLGVAPMLGRNMLPDEDLSARGEVVILSYGLWTRRFSADRAIVGRSVKFQGHDMTVIGVMPEGFDFPLRRPTQVRTPSSYTEFWASLPADTPSSRGAMGAVARLRPAATLAMAQQDLRAIGAVLARKATEAFRDNTLRCGWLRDRAVEQRAVRCGY